ncbi:hypothetical protein F7725_013493 [Dissostichus mawsoni]|uniref:CxC3 like cysteine cluster domain-containing protein n=1 Tax=Dissostichus mawsoni TaxID=36200 RepID=A0A7J5YS21_DISMA|nr:hypothetical protein F7725_013493 [Dissostichus mawsoni]
MVWLEEDHDGQPMPKRRRTGKKRKRSSATGASRSVDLVCTPSTRGQESETGTIQSLDSLIQEVQELLGLPEEPLPSQWKERQASTLEKWMVLRPFMVNQMLSSEKPKEGVCQHCRQKVVVVTCQDCLPRPLSCTACVVAIHKSSVLHNRSSMVEGFLRPLSPSTHITEDEGGKFSYHERECFIPIMHPCCDCATGQMSVSTGKEVILIGINGRYNLFLPQINCTCGKTWSIGIGDLVESGYWPATVNFETLYAVDLFTTYEDLKITAPGMSRQAFVSMLEHRTKLFGRVSTRWKVVRYVAKSFLEWTYTKFEVERLSQVQHFQFPSCTPSMFAVAINGNRKLYRFKSQPGPCGFFDGVFLAKDAEVSSFVDYIHGTKRHNPAKGRCGSGQWSAARETANKSASKLDEEGVEVAVCRHGFLLKGLNMFRGEIFAYPLYLQKQLSSRNVQFFCSDVVCKYWPYLQRVASHCPELQNLLNMRPFLSIMHAKAHSWLRCKELQKQQRIWRNSPLNCHYRTTKYSRTPIQNDLQKTIEGLYLSIKQRKCQLYRQSGGNKRRHKLRKKIVEEKKALEDAITEHNAVVGEADKLPPPNELLAEDNYSWKWECHGDMVQKKKVYDKVMLLTRLKEEAVILVHEVKQHWEYMRSVAGKIDHLSSQLSEGITGQSSTEALTERGREGLLCVLKKQLHKVKVQQAMALYQFT